LPKNGLNWLLAQNFTSLMQQCWLELVYHCLGPGAALENMF
jgi:hypothetical protein